MVVAGVPVGKLFYLIIKQVSRPISKRMKLLALQSEFFRKYICVPPANAYNWVVTNVRIRTMGSEGKVKVLKLTEEKAIELGAELIGELTIFTTSTILIAAEYSRQSKKAQAKEEAQNENLRNLRSEIDSLKSQIESHERRLAYIQEQQQQQPNRGWKKNK